MNQQVTRTFDAKGCRLDLCSWGKQIEVKGDDESVTFENVPQDQIRGAVASFVQSFRYGQQDDLSADQWLENLSAGITETIRKRQDNRAEEKAA